MLRSEPVVQGEFLSLLRTGDVRALFARYSDILLAILVAVIVGMMIVPLPTFVLDLFVTLNIAIAVSLLLIAIYVSEALRIATFPSLLLITTLFRLAIEVSATRLILLKANAGQVIHAFGNFVVAGNLVVGVVVFLILTMIQFIVIAKGSERVVSPWTPCPANRCQLTPNYARVTSITRSHVDDAPSSRANPSSLGQWTAP